MKIYVFLFSAFFLLFTACQTEPTGNDENNENKLGTLTMQMDMTSAPAEIERIEGLLYRVGYDTIRFSFEMQDTTASATVEDIP